MTKSVVILGGGTAGWLSAIFIKNYWPDLTVTVIEDPKRPPIIAGESGNLPINGIYNNLGIDIIDWVKETGATPKQGGEFYNWNGKGHKFYHSLFSEYYTEWAKTFPSKKERYFYFRELIGSGITPCDIPHSGQCGFVNDCLTGEKDISIATTCSIKISTGLRILLYDINCLFFIFFFNSFSNKSQISFSKSSSSFSVLDFNKLFIIKFELSIKIVSKASFAPDLDLSIL